MNRPYLRIAGAAYAALCFVLSFHGPMKAEPVCMFSAVLVLLIVFRGLDKRPAFWLAFAHGMAAYGIALSWFWNIFSHVAIALYAILAFFVGLFAVGQSMACKRGWSPWRMVLFTATSWTGIEFFRSELFVLDFPWMTPAVAVGPHALLPWIGVYGVSFVIVALMAMLLHRRTIAFGIIGLGVFQAGVVAVRNEVPIDQSVAIRFAALQFEGVSFDVYRKATEALDLAIDLVLWPEEAVPYDVRTNKADMASLKSLVQKPSRVLVLGTQTRPAPDHWFNTALTMDSTGVLGEH